MKDRKALWLNLAVAVSSLSIALACAELGLRWFYPSSNMHYVLLPNQTVTLTPAEEHVPGVSGPATYRTSSEGIRGDGFSESDEYRILAIGGSTTQNGYLDQSETWTLQLGARLNELNPGPRTWSGDIGRSGHTARSHVLQFEQVTSELPGIDAVVMLVGVNDLTVALRQGYEYEEPAMLSEPRARNVQMRQAFVQVPGGLHDRLTMYQEDGVSPIKRTATYQLLRRTREALVQSRGGTQQDRFGESYVTWRENRATAPAVLDSLPDLGPPLAEYKGYLDEIATLAVTRDIRLIFLTQPTLWRSDLSPKEESMLWLGGTGDFQSESGHDYFSPRALREAMDAYNTTSMNVCAEFMVECYDLAAVLPSDTTIFYDDVHFTERGSTLVAEHLAQYMSDRPPYSDANHR